MILTRGFQSSGQLCNAKFLKYFPTFEKRKTIFFCSDVASTNYICDNRSQLKFVVQKYLNIIIFNKVFLKIFKNMMLSAQMKIENVTTILHH